jgi:hypothetical protein
MRPGCQNLQRCTSIFIGLILAVTAIWLAYEIKGFWVGVSALPHVVEKIRSLVILIPAGRWRDTSFLCLCHIATPAGGYNF